MARKRPLIEFQDSTCQVPGAGNCIHGECRCQCRFCRESYWKNRAPGWWHCRNECVGKCEPEGNPND